MECRRLHEVGGTLRGGNRPEGGTTCRWTPCTRLYVGKKKETHTLFVGVRLGAAQRFQPSTKNCCQLTMESHAKETPWRRAHLPTSKQAFAGSRAPQNTLLGDKTTVNDQLCSSDKRRLIR